MAWLEEQQQNKKTTKTKDPPLLGPGGEKMLDQGGRNLRVLRDTYSSFAEYRLTMQAAIVTGGFAAYSAAQKVEEGIGKSGRRKKKKRK